MFCVSLFTDRKGFWADLLELFGGSCKWECEVYFFVREILLECSSERGEIGITCDEHCDTEGILLGQRENFTGDGDIGFFFFVGV